MKRILFAAILASLVISASAQVKDTIGLNLPIKDNNIIYEGVVDAPGKSKDDLYKNVKLWFVDYFKSSKDVIQNEDRSDGEIIGKGIIPYYVKNWVTTTGGNYKVTIRIDCKDHKYRFMVYDLTSILPGFNDMPATEMLNQLLGRKVRTGYTKSYSKKALEAMNVETLKTVEDLKTAMSKQVDSF